MSSLRSLSRWRRTTLLVVLAAGLSVLAAGCGGGGGSSEDTSGGATTAGEATTAAGETTSAEDTTASTEGAEGGSLVVLSDEVAPSLDVDGVDAANLGLQDTVNNLMDGLIAYPTTLQDGVLVPDYKVGPTDFAPELAESWELDADGVTWTFKLREGVMSCAGNEMTADDVLYTFARAKSVSGASPVAWFLSNVSGLMGLEPLSPDATDADKELAGEVTKIDDYTVQFKQIAPNELFPRVLEIFPLHIFDSKEMLAHATDDDPWSHQYTNSENSPGFGPYCLESWTKGQEVVLTSNPNYWNGQPTYTRVTVRKVPAEANRIAGITSGEADIVQNLTPKGYADVEASGKADVLSWQNNAILAMGINYAYPPFDTPQGKLIRQAIAYAIPYDEIIEQDYQGLALKWNGLVESNYNGYVEIDTYNTDIEKAKQLLVEAGFPNGEGLDQYGDAFTLNYASERSSLLEPIANRIKTSLAEIGIPLNLAPVPNAQIAQGELVKRDMPMFFRDANRPLGPDVGYAALLWYVNPANGGLEASNNENFPEFDALFAESQQVTGEERAKILEEMQNILMDELPLIPIVEIPSRIAVKPGLTNWRGTGLDTLYYWSFK